MVLEKVNYPMDLRSLNIDEMNTLASEIREAIIKKVDTIGGHFGPNLGIVETTIAMHYVFNAPVDKFVFDVSHQCYTHKILTGRKEGFLNPDKYMYYTGYTAPEESEYDMFKVGHTSTSVSLATGLAKARDLVGGKENVVALIGDGSLTGGEALEGLNNASVLNSNIIIVVNDNDMSIAENYGGLYKNLAELRNSNGTCENNFFKTMGFDYKYVSDGHDIESLINAFESVKDTDHPTILHIHTTKGKGCALAEENKEAFHWIMPNMLETFGKSTGEVVEDYNSIGNKLIMEKAKKDKRVIVINPATPGVHGFSKQFRDELGSQYTDTGIAEEHAVAYSSALAKGGAKPILAIMSSFVQRTYDQISQDLCLNNSPVTMLVYWGTISGADATHLGCFDVSMLSNIPNLVYLAPTSKEEYLKMLDWSIEQTEYPVAIRVPFGEVVSTGVEDKTDYSNLNTFKMAEKGSEVAILGLGNFFGLAKSVKDELKSKGINATLINPVYMTGLDESMLEDLKLNHKVVITLEDGILDGGFGEKITRFYGNSDIKVLNYGAKKEFTDRIPLDDLYNEYRLKKELIVEDVMKMI
ncbi:TPA: 1-deoxy-D-xylulose-5-phosphate synthase [Candidatus Gastranaerophilales bacterium HUM_9]|nr:MAG TPA: 1-deoxy-D-xylulose-5-phosphate synthase [Candidatus Gastranaerophilales bacterium HUM_9]HBX34669.1 1-deoxy-D-xylulose-5-phosphate synthase [Cyanobacteria bacterium UBA11440]